MTKLTKRELSLAERRTELEDFLAAGGSASDVVRWRGELETVNAAQAKRITSLTRTVVRRAGLADEALSQSPALYARRDALKRDPNTRGAGWQREMRIVESGIKKARGAPRRYTRATAKLDKLVALIPAALNAESPLHEQVWFQQLLSPEEKQEALKVHLPSALAAAKTVLDANRHVLAAHRGGNPYRIVMDAHYGGNLNGHLLPAHVGGTGSDSDRGSDDGSDADEDVPGRRATNGTSNSVHASETQAGPSNSATGEPNEHQRITISEADVQVSVPLPQDQPYVWHGRHRVIVNGVRRNVHVELVVSMRDPTPEPNVEQDVKIEPDVKVEPDEVVVQTQVGAAGSKRKCADAARVTKRVKTEPVG